MRRPVFISICIMAAFLFACPLSAGEELVTKLFFDNWLVKTTAPLEEQIKQLRETLAQTEKDARQIRSQVGTEIKVVIGGTTAYIDGKPVTIDAAPLISNGRAMVPVRFIGETFGASFSWDEKARKVTYTLNETKIELYIDKTEVRVNDKSGAVDTAPVIVNGRAMVPVRFVGQYMGAAFEWDGQRQIVTILY